MIIDMKAAQASPASRGSAGFQPATARVGNTCHKLLAMLCSLFFIGGCVMQNHVTVLTATKLRCEYQDDPLGIDQTEPRLDWQLVSTNPELRSQKQTAYRILVASSEENLAKDRGDLWDTGKIDSDETTQIVYAGKSLSSRQRAFWKVRLWNGESKDGARASRRCSAWACSSRTIGKRNGSAWTRRRTMSRAMTLRIRSRWMD